ncbi:hypothetical protein GI374_09085 [Paracoccus sp. S-4012]|uniref:DUF5333 domain-containing protein n=1 Tax=Paracoccus sp. S-4012 TaxID=2665648 RepID=UPI0012B0BD45|nr:DUF5333 domain-containing protein [Paracoccus sp. S-4012]MRX50596.1 hypothetical protein [Paracoccus sp. S-4012]
MKILAASLALAFGLGAAMPAVALEPLSEERYINDRLISARIADRIRRTCPSIDARLVYAWSEARALKRYAEQEGYSAAQIDAFLDSDADKARIYAIADDYLARNGATDQAGACALGRAEIERRSIIGSLLVAK